jgi:preprotein translocase subunit SecD
MSTTNKTVKTASRPGRSLAILAILLIAMTSLVFIQGATSVRLGLDLSSGTSVTLQPRIAPGEEGAVTNEAIDQAVEIIRLRVDGQGVAESEVKSQGSGANRQIVVSLPGVTSRELVDAVGKTAEMRFRQVLAIASGPPTAADATPTPPAGVSAEIDAQFSALDCRIPGNRQGTGTDLPTDVIIACDEEKDGISAYKYILAPAEVLGRQISDASADLNTEAGSVWAVNLTFDSEGAAAFGALTSRVIGLTPPLDQVAIVLDGVVISAPQINEAIPSGNAQISGKFTAEEARDLAKNLEYGSLPLAFDRGEVNQVSATLGADSLNGGLLAGVLGLGLVMLYSLLYYRGLGLVTIGSLTVAAGVIYLLFLLLGKWIGFTLTLAGIAGAIVAIGVTADSFIIYFERIKDEMRDGKSMRTAVETGWLRARRTILVADFVSLIAAVLLYIFAVGGVRGFAFTLGLTTLVDLLIVFFFTKPLVELLARVKFFSSGHRLSGFSSTSLGTLVAKEA